jgi:hypothetical protein
MTIELICIVVLALLQLDTSRKLASHRRALVVMGEQPEMKQHINRLIRQMEDDNNGT